ncbi:MAG: hypothetical protein ABEJ28_02980 [Salinigranum sp.]
MDGDDGRDRFENSRGDLLVAAVSGGGAVALTYGVKYGFGRSIPVVARLVPLFVYVVYLVVNRLPGERSIDDARLWGAIAVAVTAFTFVLYAA